MVNVQIYVQICNHIFVSRVILRDELIEGYLIEECITFRSKYLNRVQKSLNQPRKNQEDGDTEVDERNEYLRILIIHLALNEQFHLIV